MKVEVNDLVSFQLTDIYARVSPQNRRGFMAVMGRTSEREYRRWFTSLDASKPNKKGWSRKHFWARLRRATAYVPSATTDDTAKVSIADPAIRLKVRGGVVTAKRAKYLAIPMNEEAYEAGSPRSGIIADLAFVQRKGRGGQVQGYLAKAEAGDGVVLYYRLVRSVTVPAEPDAVPPRAQVAAALEKSGRDFIARKETT